MTDLEIRLLPEMQNQLAIKSLRNLENKLGTDRHYLRRLALSGEKMYKPFKQEKKRKPFQQLREGEKAKLRSIDNPRAELKFIQRRINLCLLKGVLIPDYMHGATGGKTIRTNAATHKGATHLVKMDITSYFPNLTNNHIYRVWHGILGCSPPVARLLTQLTTFERRLPQGAPTSSALANIYLSSVMPEIVKLAQERGVHCSAYVDDLIFSGQQCRTLMEPMRKLLARDGLKLAAKKRKVLGPCSEKVVTGVRLGASTLRAPIDKKKDLRAAIHKLTLGCPLPGGRTNYLMSVTAKLRHIESICLKDGLALRRQLNSALRHQTTNSL